MDSFQLKVLAMVAMLIDHVGAALLPDYVVLRCIGRISFPIFCFLLVEGFFYTRDVYKYMLRFAVFVLISEIPYDLVFYHTVFSLERQNVFLTLFIGLGLLCALQKKNGWFMKMLEVLLAMLAADMLHADYGSRGILLICCFYMFREHKALKLAGGMLWNFFALSKIQCWGALAMLPIGFYNGEKGRGIQYFFYVFYPLHLLVIYMIYEVAF